MKNFAPMRNCLGGHVRAIRRGSFSHTVGFWHYNYDQLLTESIKGYKLTMLITSKRLS